MYMQCMVGEDLRVIRDARQGRCMEGSMMLAHQQLQLEPLMLSSFLCLELVRVMPSVDKALIEHTHMVRELLRLENIEKILDIHQPDNPFVAAPLVRRILPFPPGFIRVMPSTSCSPQVFP